MAKKYEISDLRLRIETKKIEVVSCPDCGFEYNAEHSIDDDKKTIYECPICENEEKDNAIKLAIDFLDSLDTKQSKRIISKVLELVDN